MIKPTALKFKMAEIRHDENRQSAISTKNHPISITFSTRMQICNSVTVTWPNVKKIKIQDGRRQPFEKWFLTITQQPIVRFEWNFAQRSRM